ncbi:geranylgeranyl diphosphate reductase [Rhizobium sp. AAP43]|uniref:geranylgeranyl diphosphate reductase n=1 Tax=Rhizobium sp. AAP43 TaxID=1523420 RepID=UPI0006B8DA69|nr:geranylgeranyl diphosphate reductase [Rhizobium sp. AAP43]KPF43472.1 geranylgeranyl diphosphate reductase [Rhizobium sp. AAP43]
MYEVFDVAVVGGGPCGAIAAMHLARQGLSVALIDPENRIKPCGGAIPSRLLTDYAIPESLLVSKANAARIIAPSGKTVEMRIGDIGYVGMVDRATFDPYLRARAEAAGARRIRARAESLEYRSDGALQINLSSPSGDRTSRIAARQVIGSDGANSTVRRQMFPAARKPPYVFAYHEIVETPVEPDPALFRPDRCDVIYDGQISPDFYGWVFPHGRQTSIGCGSAVKGHDLRKATSELRRAAGLNDARVIRREGAPLPLKPMRRWDDGRSILLAGDAAGTVAPSSGEGIYYAMLCGKLSADAVSLSLATNKASALKQARRSFMRDHGRVFFILGLMQTIWYRNDRLRERFVSMCADPDVQRLTWQSYLDKKLVRSDPFAHARVFLKDTAQLFANLAGQK